jgi:signal transduction histidine kinase
VIDWADHSFPQLSEVEEMLAAVRLIQRHPSRIGSLVEGLRRLSTSVVEAPAEVDLTTVLTGIAALAKSEVHPWLEIATENRLGDLSPRWLGDPGELNRVLLELLTNAHVHGYRERGGRVLLVLDGEPHQGTTAFRIQVRDFGNGVGEEELGKLFEPFYTTAAHRGRSGLGLTIVKNVVENVLGGAVSIASEMGTGTVAEIRLGPTGGST